MSEIQEINALERAAYQQSYADGIVDLFVGLSLVWIGAAWIWLDALAGLAGVFPAVLVTAVLQGRKRLVESRVGYVRWRQPRRQWERRNLIVVLVAGVALFALGVGVFVNVSSGSEDSVLRAVGPGTLAFLLALLAFGLAFLMDARRMLAYGVVLAVGGTAAAWADANPGWPLLPAGIVISAMGTAMLIGFLGSTSPAEPASDT